MEFHGITQITFIITGGIIASVMIMKLFPMPSSTYDSFYMSSRIQRYYFKQLHRFSSILYIYSGELSILLQRHQNTQYFPHQIWFGQTWWFWYCNYLERLKRHGRICEYITVVWNTSGLLSVFCISLLSLFNTLY